MGSKPKLVRNAPSLLHAVALVGANEQVTLRNIRRMARGTPPALYREATDIVLATLRGTANGLWTPAEGYDWACSRVEDIGDEGKKACAEQVVRHLKPYLSTIRPQWLQPLSMEYYQAGPNLQIPVRLSALMGVDGKFVVLVLHLWRKPLELEQRHAAIAILHNRLQQRPELAAAELHFVDVSIPEGHKNRQCRLSTWSDVSPMATATLKAFTDRFYNAWQAYLLDPDPELKPSRPKKPKPSDQGDIFGDDPPNKP
jgi:hypothetical protein